MPKLKSESSLNSHLFSKFLNAIWREAESVPFHYPVNFKELGLLDYPIVIKNPMDLSTMRKNIKNNKYVSIKSFIEDLNLIWSNCKQYNLENSEIYGQAERMEKLSKKLLTNILKKKSKKKGSNFLHRTNKKEHRTENEEINLAQKNEISDADLEEKTFKEKIKICQIIKKLSTEQLTDIIKIIQKNNCNAIEIISEEKFHIKLEELSSTTITRIFNYFEEIKIMEKLNNYI